MRRRRVGRNHLATRNKSFLAIPGDRHRVRGAARKLPSASIVRRGPTAPTNSARERHATGAGVEVGIIDTVFYGILPLNHLGDRVTAQYDFRGKTPPDSPDPLLNPIDHHETLVADVIAGDHPVYMGVAPGATIVDAAIDDVTFDTRRAASAWLSANRGTRLLNLSAGFGANTNGSSTETMYWDWFMRSKDALLIAAAGNTGGQITIPADSFNGIAVGAMNDATLTALERKRLPAQRRCGRHRSPRQTRYPRAGRKHHRRPEL